MTTSRINLNLDQDIVARAAGEDSYTLHVLPCKVDYSGPVNASQYFTIERDSHANNSNNDHNNKDDNKEQDDPEVALNDVTYIRGRKLLASHLSLNDRYTGVVFRAGAAHGLEGEGRGRESADNDDDSYKYEYDDNYEVDPVSAVKEEPAVSWTTLRAFREVTVWGHESKPDMANDPWIAGIEEWTSLAASIHAPL